MSKFLGKFRKNKDYNDDYDYEFSQKKRNRSEHAEIKKIKNQNYDDILKMYEEDRYYEDYTKSSRKNSRRSA